MAFVCGCAEVTKDEPVTLVKAMEDVGRGLRAMHIAAHTPLPTDPPLKPGDVVPPAKPADTDAKPFGLYANEVTVTFNVESKTTKASGNTLVLSADVAPPVIPIKAGISDTITSSNTSSNSRGNTIVVTFKNPAFAPSGTLVHDTVIGCCGDTAEKKPAAAAAVAKKPASDGGGGDKKSATEGADRGEKKLEPGVPGAPAAPAAAAAEAPAAAPPQPMDRAADRVIAFQQVLEIMEKYQLPAALLQRDPGK